MEKRTKNKSVFLIAACYLAIIIFTCAAILISGRNYTVYLDHSYTSTDISVEYSVDGVLENTDIRENDGIVEFDFKALKAGSTSVIAKITNGENSNEYRAMHCEFKVLPTGIVYNSGFDFGGYRFVILGMAMLTLFSFALCIRLFLVRKKKQFFSYRTVLDLALIFYFGLQGLMYTGLYFGSLILPYRLDGWQVYNLAGFIMTAIFFLSIPLIVIFAGFLSLSNLALIRREGFSARNLYGLLISFMLFAGSALCIAAAIRNPNSTGVSLDEIRDAAIRVIVSSAFVYFECNLLATLICTLYASKHTPKYNQDFIVILGCKIRKDGTPLPLLQGRIDRALGFYKEQLESTGRQAIFIPSGGKGSDEIISEAESMKNYLIKQGIDEKFIIPETESQTTLQNMKYSKAIADERKENANILFTTTNYHVFRSGILSAKAGMRADGIGAKTKWYFWPNAQMREFIGLIANEWKLNALFIALTVALSALFANISTIIDFMAN